MSSQKCTFCEEQNNLTREHIPPKNLFFKPKPNNLITVPSCRTCNLGFQKDEEYFRIAISGICGDSVKFQGLLLQNVNKQLAHQPKLATTIQGNLQQVEIKTKILYGWRSDDPRIGRIFQKIIRGLHFHERRTLLPQNQGMSWNIIDEDFIEKMGPVQFLIGAPVHDIGNGIFQYKVRFSKTGNSLWLLKFYDTVEFFAITLSSGF
ncbi:MAG: hypothetical protein HYT79_07305 [Elusimicrobia bacterium]|nr:hypothetical protein [Elusimicrobiota bacterium]